MVDDDGTLTGRRTAADRNFYPHSRRRHGPGVLTRLVLKMLSATPVKPNLHRETEVPQADSTMRKRHFRRRRIAQRR